jgi:hypothetical protein
LPTVHQQLLDVARENDLFYFYQTARAPQAIDLKENQELLGRLLQSSKVHVSWPVEITDVKRAESGGPITARWFESAACAGAVVGTKPANPEFDRLFPYAEFVHELHPDAPDATRDVVGAALADVAGSADRLALAEHTLALDTWKSRWRTIVETCDL